MRAAVLIILLTIGILLPSSVRLKADTTLDATYVAAPAQAMQFKTPAPEVTAAGAAWQANDEPIVVSGLLYVPTREMRMFDGMVMQQIDVYQRVPIYADTTREPFTIVYVPISRDRLRSYERAPVNEFPVASGRGARTAPPVVIVAAPELAAREVPEPAGTTGTIVTTPPRTAPAPRSRRSADAIARARATNGIYVEYGGTRWYSNGAATTYSTERFTQIGDYRGFPVYRDRAQGGDEIWIAVVDGGPLAPFKKR
jgi:hypothetical protein